MARIQIEIPDKIHYTTVIKIRISDLNYGGHVGNDRILVYMQEARMKYIRSLGFESEVKILPPVGIIVADSAVVYRSESFYGENMEISIHCSNFNKYGFDMYYVLKSTLDKREIARGKTGIVCFDYQEKKLSVIPSKFVDLIHSSIK